MAGRAHRENFITASNPRAVCLDSGLRKRKAGDDSASPLPQFSQSLTLQLVLLRSSVRCAHRFAHRLQATPVESNAATP